MKQMSEAKLQNQSSVHLRASDAFVKEYAPLVKRIAHHLLTRLPAIFQVEDLVQAGMIGLIEAARNFNEEKGASKVPAPCPSNILLTNKISTCSSSDPLYRPILRFFFWMGMISLR